MTIEKTIDKYLVEKVKIPKKKGPVHITKGASAEEIRKAFDISDEDREAAIRIINKMKERGIFK